MAEQTFTKETLQASMSSENYQSLVSMKTNYGGNFLSGLPTDVVVSSASIMDSATNSAIGAVLGFSALATNAATESVNAIYSTASNIANLQNVLVDFTNAAIQDMTAKSVTMVSKATLDMLKIPSLIDATAKSTEYLQYFIITPQDALYRLATPQEVRLKLKEKLSLANMLKKFNDWINKIIGDAKAQIDKYIQKFKDFLNKILEYATKGVDFLCKQVSIAELDVVDSIECLLYGGNPILKRKLRDKIEYIESIQSQIDDLNEILLDDDFYISVTTPNGNIEKQPKNPNKHSQMTAKRDKLNNQLSKAQSRLLELQDRYEKKTSTNNSILEEIKELKQSLKSASDENEKTEILNEIITKEASITRSKGIVGFVNSYKETAINQLALRIAKTEAEPINEVLRKTYQKAKQAQDDATETAKSKIVAAVKKAIINLLLVLS